MAGSTTTCGPEVGETIDSFEVTWERWYSCSSEIEDLRLLWCEWKIGIAPRLRSETVATDSTDPSLW